MTHLNPILTLDGAHEIFLKAYTWHSEARLAKRMGIDVARVLHGSVFWVTSGTEEVARLSMLFLVATRTHTKPWTALKEMVQLIQF